MARADFVHLHTHSHYSLLEAIPKIPELVAAAKADGQKALALTDNGNLYGAIEFYEACKKQGIKPIIGVDFFLAPRTRHDKEHQVDEPKGRLVLLAKNEAGYHNLMQLVSKSHLEGFYHRPRVDRELLETHRNGLVAILPAHAGEHAHALRHGDTDRAMQALEWYRKLYGDPSAGGCFVEITRHPEIDGHEGRMQKVKDAARKAGIPLLAAHDVYYLKKEDSLACDLVNKIRTASTLHRDADTEPRDFSFISCAQMREFFADIPEALENTLRVAEICNLELKLGTWVFPDFPLPLGVSASDELRSRAEEGFATRNIPKDEMAKTRLEYELSIIQNKGYSSYFLVVADLLRHAREKKILTNTRGSAAGSLVSYLTGITTVNPLEYNLPFERFLNPERPSPPDIDMDLADDRRDELIDYVRQKYGEQKVAQIGTFGTMMARAAVRDVTRALGQPYSLGDTIAKLIPFGKQGFPVSIASSLKNVPELAQAYKKDADTREVIDLAQKIEGNARHVGVHAAGVVIAPTAVTDYSPVQFDPKGGKIITQYDMYAVEDAGLLKFDFLGLTNLSVLADSVTRVKMRLGIEIDLERLPLDDKKTYEMLARGETLGVFQLASPGMTNYLMELKPSTIHDINAMVALYRPGPMAFIPAYIERKKDPKLVRYLEPRMEAILKNSYGVITYQDDVLEIAVKLAGYSWLEADKFRKAMGKKIPAEMAAQKEKFKAGCLANHVQPAVVQKLWEQIETFAAYGFNKCLTADTRVTDAHTGVPTPLSELLKRKSPTSVYALTDKLMLTRSMALQAFENGVKQIYKLTTRSGRTIRTTINHPFRTFEGWVPLEKLGPGMRIAAARHIPVPSHVNPLRTYEAITLGYLLSEGNLCHPHGVYFYSTQEDEIEDFSRSVREFPNIKIKIDRSKSAASVYVGQIDQRNGNSLRNWLRTLDLIGKTATEKFVPACAFSADNISLAVFLAKLWQGDGCVSIKNQQVYYATSSHRLAEDVQHLLLRFEILSTIHTKQFHYRGTYKLGWTVNVCGKENLSRFAATIGRHLIGVKKHAMEIVCQNSQIRTNNRGRGTSDTVPMQVFALIRDELARAELSPTRFSHAAGISERLAYQDARKRGYTRAVLGQMADALDSALLRIHATSDIFWDEIVSILPDGCEMTYDLSVPGPANFVANGFIVHNSHAASYGNLAYKTAYMKANYPVDYMAALLTADAGDVEKISETIIECKRMKIAILPPSANESKGTFTVADDPSNPSGQEKAIRFGMYSIKNFGTGVADSIIAAHEKKPFADVADFLSRIPDRNLNKKSLESLIQSGALDELGERGSLLGNIDMLLNYHREHLKAPSDQGSLFGSAALSANPITLKLPNVEPATMENRLAWEKELLGLYVSGHPLDKHKDKLTRQRTNIKNGKEKFPRGVETVIAGFIETAKTILTKNGEKMVFARLADYSGSCEIVAFPRILKENDTLFSPGACVLVKGKFSDRNGEASFVVERAKAL